MIALYLHHGTAQYRCHDELSRSTGYFSREGLRGCADSCIRRGGRMSSVWELLLYIPVTLVALTVLEVCKSDDPRRIARKVLKNFTTLTLVLVMGSTAVFFLTKYF